MKVPHTKLRVTGTALVLVCFGLAAFLGVHYRQKSLHVGSTYRELYEYIDQQRARNHRTGVPPFKRIYALEAASQETGDVVIATEYYLRPKQVFAVQLVQVFYWTIGVNDVTNRWIWTGKF